MSPDPVTGSSRDDYERTKNAPLGTVLVEDYEREKHAYDVAFRGWKRAVAERDAAVKALRAIEQKATDLLSVDIPPLHARAELQRAVNAARAALSEVQR